MPKYDSLDASSSDSSSTPNEVPASYLRNKELDLELQRERNIELNLASTSGSDNFASYLALKKQELDFRNKELDTMLARQPQSTWEEWVGKNNHLI
jgi:hypothetical protein